MPRRVPTAAQEIAHLESHVREAMDAIQAGRSEALRTIKRFHPKFKRASLTDIRRATFSKEDARLLVAVEHGFPSWKAIRKEAAKGTRAQWNLPIHERTEDAELGRAIKLVNGGNLRHLTRLLRAKPGLSQQRIRLERSGPFAHPSLLEIAAANHQRNDKIPRDIIRIATLILDAGARRPRKIVQNALNLACAKPWPNESIQRQMIRLLLRNGARPEPAIARAAFQGATAALEELAEKGGAMDFVALAALGRAKAVRRRLPLASPLMRRKALALASVHGQTPVVRILLDSGLDPNAFNPRGFYEHSTPIHQAIWFGHFDTVKLFVRRGVDLTIRDKAHGGTPLGWAEYAKRDRLSRYLRNRSRGQ